MDEQGKERERERADALGLHGLERRLARKGDQEREREDADRVVEHRVNLSACSTRNDVCRAQKSVSSESGSKRTERDAPPNPTVKRLWTQK